jgi:hypothetical protein
MLGTFQSSGKHALPECGKGAGADAYQVVLTHFAGT